MAITNTLFQVIQWMTQPTDLNLLRDFAEWKEKCDIKVSHRYPGLTMTLRAYFRVSPSALCPMPVPWPRGSCPGRPWGCTPAWSAPTSTPGSSTPPATGSASSNSSPSSSSSHSTINAWTSSSSPLKETFILWTMNQSKFSPKSPGWPLQFSSLLL